MSAKAIANVVTAVVVIGAILFGIFVVGGGWPGIVVAMALTFAVLKGLGTLLPHLMARRYRESLLASADPSSGPPSDAVAVPIPQTVIDGCRFLNERDWDGLQRGLGDGVRRVGLGGDDVDPESYVLVTRRIAGRYPDLHVDPTEACSRQGDDRIVWISIRMTGTPRRGPALDATYWERWAYDEAGALVEVVTVGVSNVA